MLDFVSIFSRTGLVLWQKSYSKLKGNPVDDLISQVLIEEKAGTMTAELDLYTLKWAFANGAGFELVIVVIYSKLLKLLYVDEFLALLREAFLDKFGQEISLSSPSGYRALEFEKEYEEALEQAQKNSQKTPRSVVNSDRAKGQASTSLTSSAAVQGSDNQLSTSTISSEDSPVRDLPADDLQRAAAIARLKSQNSSKPNSSPAQSPSSSASKDNSRHHRVSNSGKISKQQAASLDRSKPVNSDGSDNIANSGAGNDYLPEQGEKPQWEIEQEEAAEFEASTGAAVTTTSGSVSSSKGAPTSSSWSFSNTYLGGILQTITGGKRLTKDDLSPVMSKIREALQEKNVAQEIADDICSSVSARLEGYAMESFTSVHSVATNALKDAVQRVLTPRRSIDILREVLDAKAEGRVFSIVFVGINGVGKSTSLAKVGYFLKQHGVNVLIAACDTFRSGAVEQLRTHSRCLDAPLFERGYDKDPSKIAAAALQHAKTNKFDCVLIDTAGRMQNNEKLLRELAQLIGDNAPDIVLFVGEALVGNDGIDQLTMFDQALVTYSPLGQAHRIDGIILTKFDTIDDKVGAALSMSYKSGQPIVFVGTGQKYTHLKRLNVSTVVKHLFSATSSA